MGKKGDLLGLEVNMRAPGAYMPDMINYACDCDVYDIWAEMLVNDCMDQQIKRKYYVGYAARRYDFQYRYSMEEIKSMYQHHILVDTSIPKAFPEGLIYYLKSLHEKASSFTYSRKYILLISNM